MEETITVPAKAAMVPAVRRGVCGLLPGFDRLDDVELVVSELLTSAIRASSGDITLRLIDTGDIRIEIQDLRGRHPRLDGGGDDHVVNGLGLASAIADRIGSVRHRSGNCTTWAVIRSIRIP
ncbi:hypothetical protein GCM10009799_02870 [Nocardiopsis rhodophaea]|uniref:Uncharacterized protein n=1 Tax=Nocardiopsis rhodophaea TaxID=280238 RepID=A0ABN2S6C3_9ACTN